MELKHSIKLSTDGGKNWEAAIAEAAEGSLSHGIVRFVGEENGAWKWEALTHSFTTEKIEGFTPERGRVYAFRM